MVASDGCYNSDVTCKSRVCSGNERETSGEAEAEDGDTIGTRAPPEFLGAQADNLDAISLEVVVGKSSHFRRHHQNSMAGECTREIHQPRFFYAPVMHAVKDDHRSWMVNSDGNIEPCANWTRGSWERCNVGFNGIRLMPRQCTLSFWIGHS
jgi:hypothetical protein